MSIKIKNGYFDLLESPAYRSLQNKTFKNKTAYWIARWFGRCEAEATHFRKVKTDLIEKYAQRHEADGKDPRTGKTWKQGDIITDGNNIAMINMKGYATDLEELQSMEVEIPGIDPIPFDFDAEPGLSVDEMKLLIPIISE